MTNYVPLGCSTLVSGQITAEDMAAAKAAGVSDIIINRPDGEEMGQPATADLKAAAEAAGLSFHDIPMSIGQLSMELIEASAQAYGGAEGKVWAFCKSGGRSAALWALANVKNGTLSADEAITSAAQAGYDLSGLKSLLDDLAG